MPSRTEAVNALRAVLVAGGLVVAVAIAYGLATMPAPPPESEGFVTGLAYVFGGALVVLALGVAVLGVVLPSVLGLEDPLGFGRGQRWLLGGGGALLAVGLVAGLLVAVGFGFQFGILAFLLFVLLSVPVVGLAVAWRLVEALVGGARRAAERS